MRGGVKVTNGSGWVVPRADFVLLVREGRLKVTNGGNVFCYDPDKPGDFDRALACAERMRLQRAEGA